jgi:hypothetical protein
MTLYVFVPTLIGIALTGWVAGMWTFRRSLTWCPRDGATLTCPVCDRRPVGTRLMKASETERSIAPLVIESPVGAVTTGGRQ